MHEAVPLQAPLHPAKVDPTSGFAVSVTLVPSLYGSLQSVPQSMPVGMLITVPEPVFESGFVTVSTGLFVNVAVTDRAPFI
jgi:hypothetical protein